MKLDVSNHYGVWIAASLPVLLIACATPYPPPPPPQDTLSYDHVITGSRMGPIYIGMPISQLRTVVDKRYRMFDFGGRKWIYWNDEGFEISIRSDYNVVCGIATWNTDFSTPEGIHLGSKQSDLHAAYGRPDKATSNHSEMWTDIYTQRAMQFSGFFRYLKVTYISIGQCPAGSLAKGIPLDE